MTGDKVIQANSPRILEEYGKTFKEVARDLFDSGIPYPTIAFVLGIGRRTFVRLLSEWGWKRGAGAGGGAPSLLDKRGQRFADSVVADRIGGMTWEDLKVKYDISSRPLWNILKAANLVGTNAAPMHYAHPRLTAEERRARSERCKRHNSRMKERRRGWFSS